MRSEQLIKFTGSLAAGLQVGIGNIAPGSSFTILQSAGSSGLGYVPVNGVVQNINGIILGSTVAERVVEAIREEKKKGSKL